MKIKNIFKKSEKTTAKANVQKLEKNQLDKLVGGVDAIQPTAIVNSGRSSGHAGEKLE